MKFLERYESGRKLMEAKMYNPDEECEKLIQNIKTLCKIKAVSINMTAKKAGLSSSALNELMNGKTRPQVYTLFKLCNALGVSINELFMDVVLNESTSINELPADESRRSAALNSGEEEILFYYKHLPDWKKSMLTDYMHMLMQYVPEKR